jgi:hypothetical protein
MRSGILFVAFGGLMTWACMFSLYKKLLPALWANRKGKGAVAEGKIARIRVSKNRFGTTHMPVVRFTTPDGQTIEFIDAIPANQGMYRPGELVTVRYDPVDPERSATLGAGTDVLRSVVIFTGLSVLFIFMAVFGVLLVIGVVKTGGGS